MSDSCIRVLLIEDNPIQVRVIGGFLKEYGGTKFSLECAETLKSGLQLLTRGGIDVVLLDLMLPDVEGFETFLRVQRGASGVPIVILSGLDDRVLALTAVKEGAEDYLVKGQVDGEKLVRALLYAVERFRHRATTALLDTAMYEFRAARAIQQRLFPTVPKLSNFDIGGMSHCASGTSGDYFDFIQMDNDRIGIVVADVSGHGLGPALLMTSTRAYIRALARTNDDVGEILTIANRAIAEDTQSENFVTLAFAIVNPHTRTLNYASAGHPSGFILDSAGLVKRELPSTSLPLCVNEDTTFESSPEIVMEPGDMLVLMSDGILDASSPHESLFGMDRALDIVRVYRNESALQIVDNLYFAVRAFSQEASQTDDITAVVLKVGPLSSV